jgi:FkbM family methyltransferase
MNNKGDDGLLYYFYYKVKYSEEADLSLFINLAQFSSCVVDIGANTGIFSILSALSNPHVEIHAFEPYGVNAERLILNLKSNSISNVKVNREALGDTIGAIKLSIPKNQTITAVASTSQEFSKSIHPELDWETIETPINTLDNYRKNLSQPIDLIKCDVETFEMSVFRGGYDMLATDRPTIIFESFLDEERVNFFNNILEKFDYHLYLILQEGIVYSKDGFPEKHFGLNFLISPVKPKRNFISYSQIELLRNEILIRPKSSL